LTTDGSHSQDEQVGERRWLTLGLARTLLGINEATLRQWADNGLVRAFRTPGGHRRFSTEDIYSLMEGNLPQESSGVPVRSGTNLLPRIRRRLKDTSRPKTPSWMNKFNQAGHERMRMLGREFVDLCLEFIKDPSQEHLDTASELGLAYGFEIASRDVPLGEALGAFIFFRNATTEAIKPMLQRQGTARDDVYGSLEQVSRLTDQVLMSLTACYHQSPDEPQSAPTKGS
jgi:excisionase family DNA binding protein